MQNIISRIPIQLRFLMVGGTNTAISYVMYLGLLFILGKESYQISLALAWFFSSFIAFTLQKTLVFQTKGQWVNEYMRCLLSWGISYTLNALLLEISVSYLKLNPQLAQFIALCIVTVLTYILFKYFAFKRGNSHE